MEFSVENETISISSALFYLPKLQDYEEIHISNAHTHS